MAVEMQWIKRLNDFVTRAHELAEVLPHGMEGQAIGIELRRAIATMQSAIEKLPSARSSEAARRTGELRQALGECGRWLQLIASARLVQSLRLDELLTEVRKLNEAFANGQIGVAESTPAPDGAGSKRRAAPARSRSRGVVRARSSATRAVA